MLEVRQLLPIDAAAYRAIRLTALQIDPDNYGSTYEAESAMPRLPFEDHITSSSSTHKVFGAFDQQELVAIAAYARQTRTKTRHRADVIQVFVSPEQRSKGLGKRVMAALIEDLFHNSEIEQAELGVITSNLAGVALYESVGFKSVVIHKGFFKVDGRYIDQRFMVLKRGDRASG